ncbi:hypothetical protein DB30_07043 [Enhygromyxa salina]|uniref:Low-density lipoprotein receptor domain class A n=1 Tax=Enhygromyxa salina TaxID=215803 RepID=A0A0C2CX29_9BACT|nr:hypothetical protein [Enhygromyxa salina]KIG14185.1 hypothetical protein DB30_07043 [Enhygromyxa salina]
MTSAHAQWLSRILVLLSPITLLPVASCGTNNGPDQPTVAEALLACELITKGDLGGLGASSEDPYETCAAQCVAASECEALELLVCGGDSNTTDLIDACYLNCLEPQGHACGGQLFPPKYVCDGYDDCMDKSDEANCPADFACDDGELIPPAYRCDQELDCEDGSDEVGCPTATTFTCANGELIPASFKCNFTPDCEDGSDEASELGCAQLTCPQ